MPAGSVADSPGGYPSAASSKCRIAHSGGREHAFCPFFPAGRRSRQRDEGARRKPSHAPLIRPFGPPSPR
ncbi:hypothetical protein EXZ48_11955 [Shinella sp. JR1-6]|nr:hypothetical protein EXZ48_11955 [Shinella sp. JR1-6]